MSIDDQQSTVDSVPQHERVAAPLPVDWGRTELAR